MIYSINKTDYRTFDIYQKNKLEPRSYFVPFSSRGAMGGIDVPRARLASDRIIMLSGEWDFRYYSQISTLPDQIDSDNLGFDKISVPSDWQRLGYENPVYINTKYPFKLDPPSFPYDCPCGVYRKKFDVDDMSKSYLVSFLGVMSGFNLYVNGEYIGYSEGAHNTAEFDISQRLTRGKNELLVVVFKWCNGTYLECQDMFRENGIFRDVYVTAVNAEYVEDFEVKTTRLDGRCELKLTVKGRFDDTCLLTVSVAEENGATLVSKTAKPHKDPVFFLQNIPAKSWSAETPNIYYLELSLTVGGSEIEFIRDIIGFKSVEIDGEEFRFNDKPVKLLGVNHHDTDPVNGYVMSPLQLEGDVRLMKENNINAVRTSHYPPDPIFLMYCDIYGLYVIDEADIETHGCYAVVYKPDLISHDKKWERHFMDRVMRMYMRDKNRPCITMWSLGNEAGGYNNQDQCYAYLKEVCPEIPVHYEGAIRTSRVRYDVTSEMYPHYNGMVRLAARKAKKKYYGAPYFLCEYCHAMGVGPGSLEEIADIFFEHKIFMGGCIWEWADHAVYHASGPYKYTYGGDHGEVVHDGNFCVDGLCYPDRKPHTGLKNVKACYSPFKIKKLERGGFEFQNRNAFRDSSYVRVSYKIEEDGIEFNGGSVELPVVPPLSSVGFEIECAWLKTPQKKRERINRDVFVLFEYTDVTTGASIARQQIAICQKQPDGALKSGGVDVSVIDQGNDIIIGAGDSFVTIGKKSGNIERIVSDGEDILNINPIDGIVGIYDNFFRAPIDNDRNIKDAMIKAGYDNLKPYVRSIEHSKKQSTHSAAVINVEKRMINYKGRGLFRIRQSYTVSSDGVLIETTVKGRVNLPLLQRVGVCFEVDPSYNTAEYYGRGDSENLPDFNAHAPVGYYKTKLADLHEPYIKPQDNNYHTDARRLKLLDIRGRGLDILARGRYFGFSAHDYTQRALTGAAHDEDIRSKNTTFVCVDGYVMGAGSNSCGPLPRKQYLLKASKTYEYSTVIRMIRE